MGFKKFLVCILLSLLMASCGNRKGQYVIGVSQCSEDIWREKLNEELQMGTYLHDNVSIRFASANDDDRRQIEQINEYIRQGVDLLIVSPNQVHTISPAIDRAYDRGIPVILFDRKTDSKKYTAFIGADNFEAGRTMGEYISRKLGGRGNVVEIAGLNGSSPAIERHKGFMRAIGKYPNIRLIDMRYADWLKDRAYSAMDSILMKRRNIDCVFGQNDRMAVGALQAARQHGLDSIVYVGIDALPVAGGGLENVRDGWLSASYIYPTRGDLVLQLAMNILEGKPYKRDNYLKGALVTRDNAGVLLMQNEEMSKQRSRLYSLHDRVDTYLAQYNHQKVYIVLFCIITLLLIGFITYIYRTAVMKRRMEEEATNAKLQFFTNISHELRTPLTLIADPVEHIIDDENLTRQQRTMLQIVRRNVNILTRLVGEILDFRKIQNGKMTLTLSDFNLSDCLKQWIDVFAATARKKKIALELECSDDIRMRADIYKVERICYNLLSNAVKFTQEGGRITLKAATDGDKVSICVTDTGMGIAKDELSRIFERFYQVKDSYGGGTGIGLAIVKSFVELHHGTAVVDSEEGKGTTFTVTLPLINNDHGAVETQAVYMPTEEENEDMTALDAATEMMTSKVTDTDNKEKPRLLVIDDNMDVRAYIMALLGEEYDISQAADGKEGLKKAMTSVPDIIVCDVMMPVMDGLEFCRRVKADTITSHIPVILLTARALEEQRAEGYDCGADAYIAKPFNGQVMKSRVKNLLESRRHLKYIYSNSEDMPQSAADAENEFLSEFRAVVLKHLANSDFSVETASAEMGLSRVQLYRKIKALTGSTPVEIIRITRLKHAERLLKSTSKTVAEVSYDVGFLSPSYFSKCYKEYFGVLPGDMQSV